MHKLPGEVCVVLVDQIFLDPEIIVTGWEKYNLLMWGVVAIPKARCYRGPKYPSKLFRDLSKQVGKGKGCDIHSYAPSSTLQSRVKSKSVIHPLAVLCNEMLSR